jgi:lipopolysaccharide/colanic/teichoic acid biosynthesis glycosyltransferase
MDIVGQPSGEILPSSIQSANASRAIHPGSGGKPANRESLDHGLGLLEPQLGLHSVPAQLHPREAGFDLGNSFSGAPFNAFNPASQTLAPWPSDLRLAGLPTLSRAYELGKRLFDLALAILILPLAATLIALIAAAIALTTGTPIFFRHRRVGRHSEQFDVWKFRTMHVDSQRLLAEHLERDPAAREEWRLTHKLRKDPRVTRLGRFLRKTSLDELPQIFNIFAGNMSFVGPRPITRAETAKYAERLPCYLAALPGITGLWQVSGRCNLSYEARILLDETYVRQWTLAGDLVILLKTPRAVFCRNGAY